MKNFYQICVCLLAVSLLSACSGMGMSQQQPNLSKHQVGSAPTPPSHQKSIDDLTDELTGSSKPTSLAPYVAPKTVLPQSCLHPSVKMEKTSKLIGSQYEEIFLFYFDHAWNVSKPKSTTQVAMSMLCAKDLGIEVQITGNADNSWSANSLHTKKKGNLAISQKRAGHIERAAKSSEITILNTKALGDTMLKCPAEKGKSACNRMTEMKGVSVQAAQRIKQAETAPPPVAAIEPAAGDYPRRWSLDFEGGAGHSFKDVKQDDDYNSFHAYGRVQVSYLVSKDTGTGVYVAGTCSIGGSDDYSAKSFPINGEVDEKYACAASLGIDQKITDRFQMQVGYIAYGKRKQELTVTHSNIPGVNPGDTFKSTREFHGAELRGQYDLTGDGKWYLTAGYQYTTPRDSGNGSDYDDHTVRIGVTRKTDWLNRLFGAPAID